MQAQSNAVTRTRVTRRGDACRSWASDDAAHNGPARAERRHGPVRPIAPLAVRARARRSNVHGAWYTYVA